MGQKMNTYDREIYIFTGVSNDTYFDKPKMHPELFPEKLKEKQCDDECQTSFARRKKKGFSAKLS